MRREPFVKSYAWPICATCGKPADASSSVFDGPYALATPQRHKLRDCVRLLAAELRSRLAPATNPPAKAKK